MVYRRHITIYENANRINFFITNNAQHLNSSQSPITFIQSIRKIKNIENSTALFKSILMAKLWTTFKHDTHSIFKSPYTQSYLWKSLQSLKNYPNYQPKTSTHTGNTLFITLNYFLISFSVIFDWKYGWLESESISTLSTENSI